MNLKELITRKVGPAPVWVYFLMLVFGVAWFIRSRQKGSSSADQSTVDPGTSAFPNAQPMGYSQDIFINLPWPVPNNNGTTTPAPVPVPNWDTITHGRRSVSVGPVIVRRSDGTVDTSRIVRRTGTGDGIGEMPVKRTSVTTVAQQGEYLYGMAANALRSSLPLDTSTMKIVSRGDASAETARLMASQRRVVPA